MSVRKHIPVVAAALAVAITSPVPALAVHRHHPGGDSEVSFSLSYVEPRGRSELWRRNEKDLTLSPQDLDEAALGARIGSVINNYVVFDVGVSYTDARETSRYRNFSAAPFGDPIKQKVRFRTLPVTFTLRFLPFGRYREAGAGRTIQKVSPYIGFGAGAVLWKYREAGEYVDRTTLAIVSDRFRSRGIAPEIHGVLGVDVALNRNLSLYVEGLVSRARDDLSGDFERKADLSRDFDGFDDLDLSSDAVTAGLRLRF